MSRRNPPAKWTLPVIVNPPQSVCYKIPVPDEMFYRAAFWGSLLDLASAYKWQDDDAHTAKAVARVWRNIIDNLITIECGDVVALHGGIIQEDFMPIRVDCDCRVWVTCCDGTEVELATVGMIQQPGQPGGSETPPPAAGGCQTYHAAFPANSSWLLPAVVNSGDVLTFSNVKGAGQDGSVSPWYCPNGQTFFAGACVGVAGTSGTDPAAALSHMGLIAEISGSYYAVTGGPITVPGGVTDAQVTIFTNDSVLSDNSGSYTLDIEFCNNNVSTAWVSTFNFVLNPYTSIWTPQDGVWVPGQGYKGVYVDANDVSAVVLHVASLSITLTRLKMVYSTPGQGGSNGLVGFETQSGFWPSGYITPGPQSNAVYDVSGSTSGVTDLFIDNNSGTTAGDTFIQVLTVYGDGTRPTGWPTS